MERLFARDIAKEANGSEESILWCRTSIDGSQETVAHPRDGVIKSLEGQRRAAIEMPVDSAFAKPRDAHDLGDGGTAVALRVEQVRRLNNDAPSGCLALSHASPYETDRSLDPRGYHPCKWTASELARGLFENPSVADGISTYDPKDSRC